MNGGKVTLVTTHDKKENGIKTILILEAKDNRTRKVRVSGKETQRRGNQRNDSGNNRRSVPRPSHHNNVFTATASDTSR